MVEEEVPSKKEEENKKVGGGGLVGGRVRVCPALVLPGNSIPGWTISRESRESREI